MKKYLWNLISDMIEACSSKHITYTKDAKHMHQIVDEDRCPGCKATLGDLYEIQQVGCPKCYDHFGKSIDIILNECQFGVKHKGKKPINIDDFVGNLEKDMHDLIHSEKYEEAAKIRDKIKYLRSMETEYKKLKAQIDYIVNNNNFEQAESLKLYDAQLESLRIKIKEFIHSN